MTKISQVVLAVVFGAKGSPGFLVKTFVQKKCRSDFRLFLDWVFFFFLPSFFFLRSFFAFSCRFLVPLLCFGLEQSGEAVGKGRWNF